MSPMGLTESSYDLYTAAPTADDGLSRLTVIDDGARFKCVCLNFNCFCLNICTI